SVMIQSRAQSALRRFSLVGLALAGAFSVSLAAAQAPTTAQSVPTFAKNVAPILQEKCQACHREGQMAPMSLLTYEQVRPWARGIKKKVESRDMPPWHLDKTVGIKKFVNDISLSDAQIDTIVRWVDGGAPMGDPKDLPALKQWPADDQWRLEALQG